MDLIEVLPDPDLPMSKTFFFIMDCIVGTIFYWIEPQNKLNFKMLTPQEDRGGCQKLQVSNNEHDNWP
jgi:hypothetical protein